jgi:dihydroxyacetone kinase DhaKLM complex PTS-EIIA-like component DhaM
VELERLGRYVIRRRLGTGGMAVVYLAHDPSLDGPVAIKILRDDDEALRTRFTREARAIARLRGHPNIVTVYDVGEDDGRPFMAMEYLGDETLAKVLRKVPPPDLGSRLALIEGLCAGLARAHAEGIIHRDIKPDNLMVIGGVLKILDFGIARLVNSGMTQDGMMMGSMPYMSPEQVSGDPIDARSDIFAVGSVLYEAISLTRAFTGGIEVLRKILETGHRPLRELVPDLSPELEKVVERALKRDPSERYQSAADMQEAIARARRALDAPGTVIIQRTVDTGRGRISGERFAELRRQQVAEQLELGQAALARGDYAAALQHAERAATIDSQSGAAFELIDAARFASEHAAITALLDKGERLLESAELDEAARTARDGLEASANHPDRALRARAEHFADVVGAAVERRSALELAWRRAQSAFEQGDDEAAGLSVDEILALDPSHGEARALGDRSRARLESKLAHERKRQAALEQVAAARALAKAQRFEEAIASLNQLVAPSDTIRLTVSEAMTEVRRAQLHAADEGVMGRAWEALHAGDLDQASQFLTTLHRPDRPDVARLREAIQSAREAKRQAEARAREEETRLRELAKAERTALEQVANARAVAGRQRYDDARDALAKVIPSSDKVRSEVASLQREIDEAIAKRQDEEARATAARREEARRAAEARAREEEARRAAEARAREEEARARQLAEDERAALQQVADASTLAGRQHYDEARDALATVILSSDKVRSEVARLQRDIDGAIAKDEEAKAAAARQAEARRVAEARAREEQARQAAEARAREEQARQAAEARAREEQARQAAEARAREEQARQAAEARAREEQARQAAEARAREEQARQAAEARAREEQARQAAEARAREEQARQAAEARAREEQARQAAEARAREKEERQAVRARAREEQRARKEITPGTEAPARSLALAAGVVGLAVVGGAALFYVTRGPEETGTVTGVTTSIEVAATSSLPVTTTIPQAVPSAPATAVSTIPQAPPTVRPEATSTIPAPPVTSVQATVQATVQSTIPPSPTTSVPPTTPTTIPVISRDQDEQAIRGIVRQYAEAYSRMNENELRQLDRTFAGIPSRALLNSVTLDLPSVNVSINPDGQSASVVATGTYTYRWRRGGGPPASAARITWKLQKQGTTWVVVP